MSKITREEIFDAVWSRPMVQVARDYGISDVGLKKICKKMAVPTPGRGYWRRKEQGYKVTTPKLPKLPANCVSEVSISSTPKAIANPPTSEQLPEGLAKALEAAKKDTELHPLVLRASESLAKTKADEKGLLRPQAKMIISVSVSPKGLDRALAAADCLIKVMEGLGNQVRIDTEKTPKLRVTVSDEELGISIEEKVSSRPYEPKPSDKRKSPWQHPRYEYEATGQLTLRVCGDLPYGLRTSWSDGKRQRIEEIVEKIVCGIYAAAKAQTQKRIDDVQRAREWEEERRRSEELQRLRRLETQRGKHLEKLAGQYETAVRIRRFVEAVERDAERLSGITVQGMEFAEWLEWAKKFVEQVDPMRYANWWDIDKQIPLWEIREGYYR